MDTGTVNAIQAVLGAAIAAFALLVVLPVYIRLMKSLVEDGAKGLSPFGEALIIVLRILGSPFSVISRPNKGDEETSVLIGKINDLERQIEEITEKYKKAKAESERVLSDALPEHGNLSDKTSISLFRASRNRLLADALRLRSKSSTNLGLGLAFSGFSALSLIFVLVFFIPDPVQVDFQIYVVQLFSRFAVVFLLQYIASFFLKLYAKNESDLQVIREEITNIELKLVAVESFWASENILPLAALFSLDNREKSAKDLVGGDASEVDLEAGLRKIISKIKLKE